MELDFSSNTSIDGWLLNMVSNNVVPDLGKPIKNIGTKVIQQDHYEYDAYDLVLEYLLSTEQVATIEEANYVMTEMDAETIQGIVEEQKKNLLEIDNLGGYGALGAIGTAGAILAKPAIDAVSNTVKFMNRIKKKKEDAIKPKS